MMSLMDPLEKTGHDLHEEKLTGSGTDLHFPSFRWRYRQYHGLAPHNHLYLSPAVVQGLNIVEGWTSFSG